MPVAKRNTLSTIPLLYLDDTFLLPYYHHRAPTAFSAPYRQVRPPFTHANAIGEEGEEPEEGEVEQERKGRREGGVRE